MDTEVAKVKNIEKIINKAFDELAAKKSLIQSQKTFKKALEHDCIYDIISKNEETVTIAFLPITTSENPIYCGIQKFEKIPMNISLKGYKTIYISRVLYHTIMTKEELKA